MGLLSKITDLGSVFDRSPDMRTAKSIIKHEGVRVSSSRVRRALDEADLTDELRSIVRQNFIKQLDPYTSNRSWDFYGRLCRNLWEKQHEGRSKNASFDEHMFYEGQFPTELTDRFVQLALASPEVPYDVDDVRDGYLANRSTVLPYVETYNRIFVFRKLTPEAMAALESCLKHISGLVEECLGTHWRVVQVRYWETKPGGEGIGTNGWHTDGFPLDAIKILSFFSPVDEERGSTQFKLKDGSIRTFKGDAGKWILFRNSVIEHCGLPPKSASSNRLTVETTIAPAIKTDVTPTFAGTNGHFPYVPWQRDARDKI